MKNMVDVSAGMAASARCRGGWSWGLKALTARPPEATMLAFSDLRVRLPELRAAYRYNNLLRIGDTNG